MKKTIFVDMDGVLTDFERGYTEMFGMTPLEARHSSTRLTFSKNGMNSSTEMGSHIWSCMRVQQN